MTEETAGADTPAAETLDVPATTETSEATVTEQPQGAGNPDAPSDAQTESGDDAAEKKSSRFSGRISELVRQRNEAERRAERAEARLREAQNTDISALDYEDQIAEKTIQRSRQEQVENERAAVQDLAMQAFKAREAVAAEKYADYSAVAHRGWEPTPAMLDVILDSEHGPDLAYHLGKNPAEFARIASLSPTRQAAELGKLEARITAPKALPKQPPAPVQPVSGIAAGGQRDPGSMSMAEYAAWRKANP